MCGTLLISLPSKHEGGDFHVTHGEDETALVTAESSESTYTYLSWFVDLGNANSAVLTLDNLLGMET